MYVLVADPEANDYKKYLESKFPALSIHGASTEKEIPPHVEKMDILVTVFRASDDVFKQAANLKWVQALLLTERAPSCHNRWDGSFSSPNLLSVSGVGTPFGSSPLYS